MKTREEYITSIKEEVWDYPDDKYLAVPGHQVFKFKKGQKVRVIVEALEDK